MHIPIRCFSCGKPLGHLWDEYQEMLRKTPEEKQNEARKNFFDDKGLVRYCCRATIMTHLDLDDIARFKKF